MEVFTRVVVSLLLIKLCHCGLLIDNRFFENDSANESGSGNYMHDVCDSMPCQNGGTCKPLDDDEDEYGCVCTLEYAGKDCNEDLSVVRGTDVNLITTTPDTDDEQCFSTIIVGVVVAVAGFLSIANGILIIVMVGVYRAWTRCSAVKSDGEMGSKSEELKDLQENTYEVPLKSNAEESIYTLPTCSEPADVELKSDSVGLTNREDNKNTPENPRSSELEMIGEAAV
ncbi:uncharacterized protein LOC144445997 isoform X2 [Glandiceps talaboti]